MDPAAEPPDPPGAVVWLWVIRTADGRVIRKGDYLARPYASPRDIADERMALLVWHVAPDYHRLQGLVCRAWREDDPEDWGEAYGDEWVKTATNRRAA